MDIDERMLRHLQVDLGILRTEINNLAVDEALDGVPDKKKYKFYKRVETKITELRILLDEIK